MLRCSVAVFAYPLLLAVVVVAQTATRKTPDKVGELARNCPGLHGGIRAQIMPSYTEPPAVMITFVLLNDSETPVDVQAGSWRIVINGSELNDSGMIFGNGPGPVGGYKILKPGETYEFGKSLPIAEYFFPNGRYKVSWKAAAFQSPTITVSTTPPSH